MKKQQLVEALAHATYSIKFLTRLLEQAGRQGSALEEEIERLKAENNWLRPEHSRLDYLRHKKDATTKHVENELQAMEDLLRDSAAKVPGRLDPMISDNVRGVFMAKYATDLQQKKGFEQMGPSTKHEPAPATACKEPEAKEAADTFAASEFTPPEVPLQPLDKDDPANMIENDAPF